MRPTKAEITLSHEEHESLEVIEALLNDYQALHVEQGWTQYEETEQELVDRAERVLKLLRSKRRESGLETEEDKRREEEMAARPKLERPVERTVLDDMGMVLRQPRLPRKHANTGQE